MRIGLVTLLVRDYDEAIRYFTQKLDFELKENHSLSTNKRWVVVSYNSGVSVLLAKAEGEAQIEQIGKACGGRVAYFIYVDDFQNTYSLWKERGVNFIETPRDEAYGKVVKFADLYGNKWDLIKAI